jgi:hypothetical protein
MRVMVMAVMHMRQHAIYRVREPGAGGQTCFLDAGHLDFACYLECRNQSCYDDPGEATLISAAFPSR